MPGDYLFPEISSIVSAQQMSVLLEVTGEPKPGNVTRHKPFSEISYDDFLFATVSVEEPLRRSYESARQGYESGDGVTRLWGRALLDSSRRAIQGRSNTIFGTLLVEIPLGLGAALAERGDGIVREADKIVKASGVEDSVAFVRSAHQCGIGGLSHSAFRNSSDGLDLSDPGIENRIMEGQIGLSRLLAPSVKYDLLASELLGGFRIVAHQASEYIRWLGELKDPNRASAAVFVSLLSTYPDSLIARKGGRDVSEEIRSRAEQAMKLEIFSPKWLNEMESLDEFLRERDLNPGTLADLTAASIFLALLGEGGLARTPDGP